MEYRQHDLRYDTRQVLSDEKEGGCSCPPMFNKKRVLLERGMHVGKLSIEKGWFMQFNCFRFVRFNRFNRKRIL